MDGSDTNYQARANIGVGASLGAIIGALFAELFSDSSLVVIAGTALGAGLGAAVGSRLRSQAPQFLWIEYPKEVGKKLILSGSAFLALFIPSIYSIKAEATLALQILLLSATSVSGLVLILTVGKVISQLDDLLRKIQLEAIAVGFGLSAFIALTLGLLDWLFQFDQPRCSPLSSCPPPGSWGGWWSRGGIDEKQAQSPSR